MTSLELLKRNLKILHLYDSGDFSRKAIRVLLNLASLSVVNHVIQRRSLYEKDRRNFTRRLVERGGRRQADNRAV